MTPEDPEFLPDVRREQAPLSQHHADRARAYERSSVAGSTRKQYRSNLKLFGEWCQHAGRVMLPADWETVRAYIAELADDGFAWSTIRQRMSAISQAHSALSADMPCREPDCPRFRRTGCPDHGIENPCDHHKVRQVAKGIRREKKAGGVRKKKPILARDLERVVGAIGGDDAVSVRDRAVLLLGFAGGFRRSELAGLDVDDLEWSAKGLRITLRSSKTNQTGKPEYKAVLPSAVKTLGAIRGWLSVRGEGAGPLFLSAWVDRKLKSPPRRFPARDVGRMVVRWLVRAGLIPPLRELRARHERNPFGAHSLRSGFITEAHDAKASIKDIMRQTGQRSPQTVIDYVQKDDVFENNASEGVAL